MKRLWFIRFISFLVVMLSWEALHAFSQGDWSAKSLNIPSRNTPWKFMAAVDNKYFLLKVPYEIPTIKSLPPGTQMKIQNRINLRDRNVEVLERLAVKAEQLLKRENFNFVPQYDMFVDELVIAVHTSDFIHANPLYRHEPLLKHLPPYTHLNIFAPEALVNAIYARLQVLGLISRARVYPVSPLIWNREKDEPEPANNAISWTQDILRVSIGRNGDEYLFTPASYSQVMDLSHTDIEYLHNLCRNKENCKTVMLPVFFHDGNILIGEVKEKIMLIGHEEINFNRESYFSAIHSLPSDEGFISLLKETSGVRKHYVLPNSENLFHLDMIMAFVGKGVVALIDPLDKEHLAPADRKVLSEIRKKLASLGFRIINVPTLTKRIESFESPVNNIFFVNREDKKRYAFVPVYPDVTVSVRGQKQSINRMIADVYKNNGINVIPIEDRFHIRHGDIHCAFKVIS